MQQRLSTSSLRKWVLTSLLTALVAVGTMLIQIPSPATQGYVNVGDAFVFITGAILGPLPGFVAGGIGSALADLLSGYAYYAPWTLIIKGLEGLLMGLLVYGRWRGQTNLLRPIVGMVVSGIWMVVGYFFAGSFLYGWQASLTSIPGNIAQALVSLAICIFLLRPLYRALGE